MSVKCTLFLVLCVTRESTCVPDTNAPFDGKDSRQLFALTDLNKDYTTTTG